MISHKYKCIFIHLPRTAGTSIEKLICPIGTNGVTIREKHFHYRQAKEKYAEWLRVRQEKMLPLNMLSSMIGAGTQYGVKEMTIPTTSSWDTLFDTMIETGAKGLGEQFQKKWGEG